MNAEFIDRLAQGLSAMGVPYRAPMLETLARFQEKLLAANARMNLTRVGAEACEAVDRNYLDSLAPPSVRSAFCAAATSSAADGPL